jgi:flagellar hook assembly protein FlgD
MRFGLPRAGRAELAIYTVQGRLVRRLVHAELPAGEHTATWDGTDDAGRHVSAGVYYAALVTAEGRFEKRMLALP